MNPTIQAVVKASTKYGGKTVRFVQKYSPEILTATGIVSGVVAGVLGARATLHVEPIIKKLEEETELVKSVWADHPGDKVYSKQEYIRDMTGSYARFVMEMTKEYAPTAAFAATSVICILGAHGIMRKRNAALLIAYNAVDKAFRTYRDRVIEEFGADKDHEYRFGIRNETITTKNGDKETTKIQSHFGEAGSPYARCFSEVTAKNWSPDPNMSKMTLSNVQNNVNDLLQVRGHVFLNEVWDRLGMERTPDGQIVGWTLDGGDKFIDFGIYDAKNTRARMFLDGLEDTVWLDPNVDGAIIDKI